MTQAFAAEAALSCTVITVKEILSFLRLWKREEGTEDRRETNNSSKAKEVRQ